MIPNSPSSQTQGSAPPRREEKAGLARSRRRTRCRHRPVWPEPETASSPATGPGGSRNEVPSWPGRGDRPRPRPGVRPGPFPPRGSAPLPERTGPWPSHPPLVFPLPWIRFPWVASRFLPTHPLLPDEMHRNGRRYVEKGTRGGGAGSRCRETIGAGAPRG